MQVGCLGLFWLSLQRQEVSELEVRVGRGWVAGACRAIRRLSLGRIAQVLQCVAELDPDFRPLRVPVESLAIEPRRELILSYRERTVGTGNDALPAAFQGMAQRRFVKP